MPAKKIEMLFTPGVKYVIHFSNGNFGGAERSILEEVELMDKKCFFLSCLKTAP